MKKRSVLSFVMLMLFVLGINITSAWGGERIVLKVGETKSVSCNSDTATSRWTIADKTVASTSNENTELGNKWLFSINVKGLKQGITTLTLAGVFNSTVYGSYDIYVTGTDGHLWQEVTDQKATCTEDGKKHQECAVCGLTRDYSVIPASHQWNTSPTVDSPSSCTEHGTQSIHCSICNQIKEGTVEEAPLAPHNYSSEVLSEPTEYDKGIRVYTCCICGHQYTEDIAEGVRNPDGNCAEIAIISNDLTLSGNTHNKDFYILKGNKLTINEDVSINGNVYVFGELVVSGKLVVNGTLNCLKYNSILSAGDYDYGTVKTSGGSITATKMNVTDSYLASGIPQIRHCTIAKTHQIDSTCCCPAS